jgi:hypothetical protein
MDALRDPLSGRNIGQPRVLHIPDTEARASGEVEEIENARIGKFAVLIRGAALPRANFHVRFGEDQTFPLARSNVLFP